MRKLIANSVLLLMLAVFFAPTFANAASNSLPACCRRGGAHHCTTIAQIAVPGQTSLRSRARCPLWREPLLVSPIAALPVSHLFVFYLRQEALTSPALAAPYFSMAWADYQRGPPELSFGHR